MTGDLFADLERELFDLIDAEQDFVSELFGDDLNYIIERLGQRWLDEQIVVQALAAFLGDEHPTAWTYFCAAQYVDRMVGS